MTDHDAANRQEFDVAALYVETGGVYFNLPGVDPWDEKRNALLYPGPYPVVAHPPCKAWCALAGMRETRYGYKVGDDGGCFKAALDAVRKWGGILEHPAHSRAWKRFGLPVPIASGWSGSLTDPGLSARVDQGWYGHQLKKPTWLYAVGVDVLKLEWGIGPGRRLAHRDPRLSASERERMTIPTPIPFRDLLLKLARSVKTAPATTMYLDPHGKVVPCACEAPRCEREGCQNKPTRLALVAGEYELIEVPADA